MPVTTAKLIAFICFALSATSFAAGAAAESKPITPGTGEVWVNPKQSAPAVPQPSLPGSSASLPTPSSSARPSSAPLNQSNTASQPANASEGSADAARTSRSSPSLTQRAIDFITRYWGKVSEDGRSVSLYLNSIYPSVVDYYGKPTPKRVVMAEKRQFVDRWPIRHTWPHTESPAPRITCDAARPECEISGLRDFDSISPARSARSTGTFRYHYEVSFAAPTPVIVSEDSRVISR